MLIFPKKIIALTGTPWTKVGEEYYLQQSKLFTTAAALVSLEGKVISENWACWSDEGLHFKEVE